ncbi:MAG: LLM class flavin-dependent oxidoreductase [Chloroflexi bacterium]|nr:LLM class flavin-dependent oxidoreductase [Chloroflexota bacterium]
MSKLAICFSNRSHLPTSDIARLASVADDAGYDAIFTNEAGVDSMCLMLAMAARTSRAKIGSGIINIYQRHPALLAAGAAAIDDVSGGRLLLGLGTGHKHNTAVGLNIPMGKPLEVMREVVALVRQLLTGEAVHHEGKYYTVRGHKLGFQPRRPDVPVFMGVLGLKAAKLAGEIADGVVLNFATVAHVEKAVAAIQESARAAGRAPRDVTISCFLQTFLADDVATAWEAARPTVLSYCRMPFYANMFALAGFEREASSVQAAPNNEAALPFITNELVDAVTLCGPLSRCTERIMAYRAAGVELPIVYPGLVAGDWMSTLENDAIAFANARG